MFRTVFVAREMPRSMASSKLFDDVALISVTFATDMATLPSTGRAGRIVRPAAAGRLKCGSGLQSIAARADRESRSAAAPRGWARAAPAAQAPARHASG